MRTSGVADSLSPDRQFDGLSVPSIVAVLFKRGYEGQFVPGIKMIGEKSLAGPAYTMRAVPTRRDLRDALASGAIHNLHRVALAEIPPGSVLVSDTGARMSCSVLGDILAESLQVRGVAGAVLDGGAADLERLGELEMPVACACSAPVPWVGTLFIADLQCPIDLRGVAVFPGDFIVGDSSGLVVVPEALLAEVAREAREKEDMEEFIVNRIRGGAPIEGTYPPDAETLQAYAAWRTSKAKE